MAKNKKRKKGNDNTKLFISPFTIMKYNHAMKVVDEICNKYILDIYMEIDDEIQKDLDDIFKRKFKDDKEFLRTYIINLVTICMELELSIISEMNNLYTEVFYPKLMTLGINKQTVKNRLNRYCDNKVQELSMYSHYNIMDTLIKYSSISTLKLVELDSEEFFSYEEFEELKIEIDAHIHREFDLKGDFTEEEHKYIRKAIHSILASAYEYNGDISNIKWLKVDIENDEISILTETRLLEFLQFNSFGEVKNQVEVPISDEIVEEKDIYKYIDDWKELSSLANSKGYNLVRSKGDHGIFKNNDGYTVIIPQGRNIGKGLSIEIQKRLDNPQLWV